jgi:hypothetical protein
MTVQNNIEIFKYTKNLKTASGCREGSTKKYSLNTRKSFQVSRSLKTDGQKLDSSSSFSLKRSTSAVNSPKLYFKSSYLKDTNEELNKSSSIEILNVNDDSEFENQSSNQSLLFSRRQSKSSISSARSIKLPAPKNSNEKSNKKIRLVQSAPLKHQSLARNSARPSSVVASTNAKIKETKKVENKLSLNLNEFCQIPKYPRLIAYLSVDAQYAMLKAYEGK